MFALISHSTIESLLAELGEVERYEELISV